MKHAIEFIKQHTPLSLVPYRNDNGDLAIGYGNTLGVTSASNYTEKKSEEMLTEYVTQLHKALCHNVPTYYGMSQNKKTAILSLVHDVGYEVICKSTFFDYLSKEQYNLASALFMMYNKKGRVVSAKKAARRRAEQALFNSIGV